MTTTVKIQAHCSNDQEVQVVVHLPDGTILERSTIENGEEIVVNVFDTRLVTVTEVFKNG